MENNIDKNTLSETANFRAEVRATQERSDRSLLDQAQRLGILPREANTQDLSNSVRQKMIDYWQMLDAKRVGLLPPEATVDDYSANAINLAQQLINMQQFHHYRPDGSTIHPDITKLFYSQIRNHNRNLEL